jgi:hypothetical protein
MGEEAYLGIAAVIATLIVLLLFRRRLFEINI